MKKQKTQRQASRKKTTAAERKLASTKALNSPNKTEHEKPSFSFLQGEIITNLMRSKMTNEEKELFDRVHEEIRRGTHNYDENLKKEYDKILSKSSELVTEQEMGEVLENIQILNGKVH